MVELVVRSQKARTLGAQVYAARDFALSLRTIMNDSGEGSRKPVKATYAHKKTRISKAFGTPTINPSSPLQMLDPHAASLIPTAEMTRRMLKRSRQSQTQIQQEQELSEPSKPKRSRVRDSNNNAQSYSMALNDVRPKSRNLKENSSSAVRKSMGSSRTLESSISSRHSSPRVKSRKSKSKAKSTRPALATKSISVSSNPNSHHGSNKDRSSAGTSLLNQEPTIANISIPDKGTHISLRIPFHSTLSASSLPTT